MLSDSPTQERPEAELCALSCGCGAVGTGRALLACSVTSVKLLQDSCGSVCKQPLSCSWKEVVVMVYRRGFRVLLIGRMKMTTQDSACANRDTLRFHLTQCSASLSRWGFSQDTLGQMVVEVPSSLGFYEH